MLTISANGDSVDIAVETLRHAYPRDIRQAVWRLEEYRFAVAGESEPILLVAADKLSPGAKELLQKRGIAYFERSGTRHLRWQKWLINIEKPSRGLTRSESPLSLQTRASSRYAPCCSIATNDSRGQSSLRLPTHPHTLVRSCCRS